MARIFKIIINKNLLEILNTQFNFYLIFFIITIFLLLYSIRINTTQSYLFYIVNLFSNISIYIYIYLFTKTKIKREKKFKNNSTVPPIENLEFVDAIDSSFGGEKERKKENSKNW